MIQLTSTEVERIASRSPTSLARRHRTRWVRVLARTARLRSRPCCRCWHRPRSAPSAATVVDPQQNIVPGATVVVTDESTSVTREAQDRRKASSRCPTCGPAPTRSTSASAGSRKCSGRACLLRAASVGSSDLQLEVGGLEDVVTVIAEGQNNITVESQSIARGLDEQQLRDLPRNSRDIQDFLTLNPNVVGGFDSIQFLGGRTYGASYIQDGQPSSAGIFGELSNAAPGPRCRRRKCRCSPTRTARSSAASPVSSSRPSAARTRFHGSSFYDYNSNELNARTYAQALNGVSRDDPNADTHDHRYGFSIGGPIRTNRTFFFGNYEGGQAEGARRRGAGHRADGGRCAAAISPAPVRRSGSADRPAVPRQPHSRRTASIRRRRASSDCSTRLPNQTYTAPAGTATYRQILPLTRNRDRADGRIDHELTSNDSLFARVSWQRRDPDAFTFESTGGNGGGGLTNLGILDRAVAGHDHRHRLDARSCRTRSSTSSAAATARTCATVAASTSPARSAPRLGIEVPALAARAPGFPRSSFPARTARRTSAISGRTRSGTSTSRRFRSAATRRG